MTLFLPEPTKLAIAAHSNAERNDRSPLLFVVQYNPDSFALRYEAAIEETDPVSGLSETHFRHSRPSTLSIQLRFDGTLPAESPFVGAHATVQERLQAFFEHCAHMDGDIHAPKYLRLQWGQNLAWSLNYRSGQAYFDCRLRSADVRYVAFDRNGDPLHAELQAEFVENQSQKSAAAKASFKSPDLTQRRTVRAGDTLPLLCQRVYGSSHHYVRVAELNGLDNFRVLPVGLELVFPPFAKGS